MSDTVSYQDIEAAAEVLQGQIKLTQARPSPKLSQLTGCTISLKFENRQHTASFKERGALNKLSHLTEAERKAGVIAMSAGNHAQGVAYHAGRLGIPATIVMPRTTPVIKAETTRSHGATVVLEGESLTESREHALSLADETGAHFVHPYDDPHVIAGQGTVALEFLASCPDIDTLVVPIGGGGLISGIAIAARHINPNIRIVGVQTEMFPSMRQVLQQQTIKGQGSTIAEGIAVKEPGMMTREIVGRLVDTILLVSETRIEQAISMLVAQEKSVVEGAGAAGLAAILQHPGQFKDQHVGLVLCGGNIDQRLLAQVLMRDLVRQGRLVRLRIALLDQVGELARLTALVAEAGGNVVEVQHQRVFSLEPAKDAVVHFSIETRDDEQLNAMIENLKNAGYTVSRSYTD